MVTPAELCIKVGYKKEHIPRGNTRQYGGDFYTFFRYFNKDCVVAYSLGDLGITMILKGKKKPFCFIVLKEGLYMGGYNYHLLRVETDRFFELAKSNLVVEDKYYFDKVRLKIMVENI